MISDDLSHIYTYIYIHIYIYIFFSTRISCMYPYVTILVVACVVQRCWGGLGRCWRWRCCWPIWTRGVVQTVHGVCLYNILICIIYVYTIVITIHNRNVDHVLIVKVMFLLLLLMMMMMMMICSFFSYYCHVSPRHRMIPIGHECST